MKLVEIDLNLIDEDSEQPRREFEKAAIEELAESIREVGLLNPIKVYKVKYGRYKIVFGNRRYKALKLLGFRKIPCILSDNTDELDIYFEQLTENIQRRDFTPIEEAEGFQKLLAGERWQVSKKYLSSRLGKTEKYITNKLALLVFGPDIRKLIHGGAEIIAGQLSEEQALNMKDVPLAYRDSLALKMARDGRSARDVKRIAALFVGEEFDAPTKEKFLKMPCHELVALSVDGERRRELAQATAAATATAAAAAEPATAAGPVATTTAPAVEQAIVVSEAVAAEAPAGDGGAEGFDGQAAPGGDKLAGLLPRIPAFEPLPPETMALLSTLDGEERAKLLAVVAAALADLADHAGQLAKVKALLEESRR